jgi:hypothetical protein
MSRTQIKHLTNTTQQVTATVNYITYVNGKQVVKLTHVNINGTICNHCWLYSESFNKPFIFYKSSISRQIKLTATIDTYYKIRDNKKVKDYCLTKVDNIKFL